jgi:hypothetical protein
MKVMLAPSPDHFRKPGTPREGYRSKVYENVRISTPEAE